MNGTVLLSTYDLHKSFASISSAAVPAPLILGLPEFVTKSVDIEMQMLSPLPDQTCTDCVQGVTTRCTGVIDCICSIAISDVQQTAKIDARGHMRMPR